MKSASMLIYISKNKFNSIIQAHRNNIQTKSVHSRPKCVPIKIIIKIIKYINYYPFNKSINKIKQITYKKSCHEQKKKQYQ